MNIYEIIIIFLFMFVVYNLGHAMLQMLKKSGSSKAMVKSLTWRIGISLLIFIVIVVLLGTGNIGFNPSPLA